jgi:hypothetical protein
MMDVPTRDSYTMAVVRPEERVTFSSLMAIGRMTAGTLGPVVASAMWQSLAASVPFVACTVLKISYDLTLFRLFRQVRTPEEEERLLRRQNVM